MLLNFACTTYVTCLEVKWIQSLFSFMSLCNIHVYFITYFCHVQINAKY